MTVFIRVLDSNADAKQATLQSAIQQLRNGLAANATFENEPDAFSAIPGSPFAYWTTEALRSVFEVQPPLEAPSGERLARRGVGTNDDFRFLRLWTEIASDEWTPLAKGGSYSPFYADVPLAIRWQSDGYELKAFFIGNGESPSRNIRSEAEYGRPGLTWPLRTQSGLGVRALPAECIFGSKGPTTFVADNRANNLLALLALMTSAAFRYFVALQMAFGSYEVGVIQRTPVPDLTEGETARLAGFARDAWSNKRSLDMTNETSHAFLLPPSLYDLVTGLDRSAVTQALLLIQNDIDEAAYSVYGIGSDDCSTIEASTKTFVSCVDCSSKDGASDTSDEDDPADDGATAAATEDALLSWLVGVSLGRFDPRLATGARAVPADPEPFDPLPSRSPGMYPEDEEPTDRPDIFVDDEGHQKDLTTHVLRWAEHIGVEVPTNPRAWLAREFFPLHIKMYSKSRRKAPIYWQLATPSARYSVWLYIHAFTKDTLFRVQNDYLAEKLAHEERQLEMLRTEGGPDPVTSQRRAIEAQETFVEELRAFLDEVKRVAPLWNPNLDDGVIINFAPLWRLVPHHKPWQKELKSTWETLCAGKYDWAHLAMHLWPERVVPKCAKDRSLAIAHDLEDVFWYQDEDEKWKPREEPTTPIEVLVKERVSPAVKAALKSLTEAPEQSGSARRGRGRR